MFIGYGSIFFNKVKIYLKNWFNHLFTSFFTLLLAITSKQWSTFHQSKLQRIVNERDVLQKNIFLIGEMLGENFESNFKKCQSAQFSLSLEKALSHDFRTTLYTFSKQQNKNLHCRIGYSKISPIIFRFYIQRSLIVKLVISASASVKTIMLCLKVKDEF